MQITSTDYSNYFASKCQLCSGKKSVIINDVRTVCSCQIKATFKHKFEQIEISPPDLKYKTWSDFTGEITNFSSGRCEIIGHLDESAYVIAFEKAMLYCFGDWKKDPIAHRASSLIIHKHIGRGNNVIIVGGKKTGRSLLASLILKEAILASLIHGLKLEFEWIKSYKLLEYARWDNSKEKDNEMLSFLEKVDFLIIDDVDVYHQGVQKIGGTHTTPADHISLEYLFGERFREGLPTIITCSFDFWNLVETKPELIARGWGDQFLSLVQSNKNTIIHLFKKGHVV